MLVLARRIGEKIMIGDDISVTVVDIGQSQVCLGVNAPPSVSVHREEIYRKIKQDQQEILS